MLVHGAAGGVGTATIQVAKGYGARTIAVVSHRGEGRGRPAGRRRRGRARRRASGTRSRSSPAAGASTSCSTWSAATCSPTRCARWPPQGRLLVVGFAAGQGIPEVKVNRLLLNNIDVRGVGWGAYAMVRPGFMQQQWAELLPMMESGVDRPADRRDVPARGVRPGAASTWTSAGRSASPSYVSASPGRPVVRLRRVVTSADPALLTLLIARERLVACPASAATTATRSLSAQAGERVRSRRRRSGPVARATANAAAMCGVAMWASTSEGWRQASMVTKVPGGRLRLEDVVGQQPSSCRVAWASSARPARTASAASGLVGMVATTRTTSRRLLAHPRTVPRPDAPPAG